MPRLLSQRKQVRPPQSLTDDRWKYLNLSQVQPNLGLAPTNNEGYTIQSDETGKHTFTNTLGKLKFEDSKITNTQGTDITIDNQLKGNIILDPAIEARIKGNLVVESDTTINGQLVVKGDNPLGTFPVINNVLYVNENGDDANDGRAMDPSRAKRTISGAVRSPYYRDGTTIRVASGHYFEDNPIPLKPSTAVIGDDLRTTFVEPLNKEDDLFHVNSGVYIAFMAMLNLKKGEVTRYAPGGGGRYTTGAYCVAFPPSLDNPIDVYYSPYIQNCTNQSGPWLFDGTMFLPNQTVQVPLGAGVASWVANTTTFTVTVNDGSVALGMAINDKANVGFENSQRLLKKNKAFLQAEVVAWVNATYPTLNYNSDLCYRDVGLIIDAVSGDARFGGNLRSREAGLAYWEGTQSLIPTEISQTVAAVNYLAQLSAKVIRNELNTELSQTDVPQVIDTLLTNGDIVTSRLADSFAIVTNMIVSGPSGLPDPVEPDYGLIYPSGLSADDITSASTVTNITSTSTGLANAQTLLQLNRSFIQSEVTEWVTQTYPALTYDRDLCFRDVGLIVDAIAIDGVIGGNIQSRIAGTKYYTGNTSNIPGEIPETVAAIEYLGELAAQIIDNQTVVRLTTATQVIRPALVDGIDALEGINASINVITNIISNGLLSTPEPVYPSLDQYVVTLNIPTVGHGNQSTIYFGYTTVYPVEDKNIPEKWVTQRSLNPSGSGGGALIDGNAPSLRSPIQSFVFDAFTQLNQGGIGIHITNNGYAQLVSVFTIFCDIGVLTENGGICSITNSNANFGNYSLVSKGHGKLEFSGIVWNPKYPSNIPGGEYYPLGYWPQNGKVEVYIPDLVNRPHIALIMEVVPPKTYLDYSGTRVPYVNAEGFPGYLGNVANTSSVTAGAYSIDHIDTSGIAVGHRLYIRDIEGRTGLDDIPYVPEGTTVIDIGFQSVTLDKPLNLNAGDGTNDYYFNLYFCGNAYYTILSSEVDNTVPQKSTVSWVDKEENETAAAIRYARDIVNDIITNTTITNTYQTAAVQTINLEYDGGEAGVTSFSEKFNIIADMIQYGQNAAPTVVKNSPLKTVDVNLQHAAKLVDDNKTFIQEEVTAFVDAELVGFTYDQAKCYRDTGLIVDSVAFDILYGGTSQSTFAGLQYWNQAGYTGLIPEEITTTTNTILYVKDLAKRVVKNDTSGMRYQNTVTQVTNLPAGDDTAVSLIDADFTVITDILSNGTDGVTDIIEPNGVESTLTNIQQAYALLQANRNYIQNEAIAFVEATKNVNYVYDRVKCARDTGILVDSFVTDLLFPGNGYTQSNFAGLQYWNQDGYTGLISEELTTSTNAIKYLGKLAKKLVTNDTTGYRYQTTVTQITTMTAATSVEATKVSDDFNIVTDIITNGTAGVTDLIEHNGTSVVSAAAQRAFNILQANKEYLQAETIAWVEANKLYDNEKCQRDTGLVVDAIVQDLMFGGTSQSTFAGIQYWNQDGYIGQIANELTTTTNAVNYVKALAQKIVTNDTSGTRYQTSVDQVTNLPAGTSAEATVIGTDFDVITDILVNGTAGVTDKVVPNTIDASGDTNVQNAFFLLQANKAYLQAEAVAYVESTKSTGYKYSQSKCSRDVGYMVDSVSIDLLYGGNRQAIQSGVYYYGFSEISSAIPNESVFVTAAYDHIKSMLADVITGTTMVSPYQTRVAQVVGMAPATSTEATEAQSKVDVITDIINNGPTVASAPTSLSTNMIASPNLIKAGKILDANKEFIVAEVIAYINANFTSDYSYDQAKCARDAGYIIDSVSFDLLYGGNRQAVQSGVYYYGFSGTSSAIPNEQAQVTAAYTRLKSILPKIIVNQSVDTTPGNPFTQATGSAGGVTQQTAVQLMVDKITDIIANGPSAGDSPVQVPLVKSTNALVLNAANLLIANKDYIIGELIAYIDESFRTAYTYDRTKCARDTGIIVDSLVSDILFSGNGYTQSNFSGLQYWNQVGYTGAIANELTTTTNAINYIKSLAQKIVTHDASGTRYQSTVTQNVSLPVATATEANEIDTDFTIITDILANGTAGVTDLLVPNGISVRSSNAQKAYDLLEANKSYMIAEAVAYVESTKTVGYSYDKSKCGRDVGFMVDSVAFDMLYGGNRQAIHSGVYYYGFSNTASAIPNESVQTTAAYTRIRQILPSIVTGQTVIKSNSNFAVQVTNLTTATTAEATEFQSMIDKITTIINTGPSAGDTPSPISVTKTSDADKLNAAAILAANRDFIKAEIIAYIDDTFSGSYVYDRTKCARDSGIIVDSIIMDVLYPTDDNSQSNFAGLQYWNQDGYVGQIANELTTTTNAINYVKELAQQIVLNITTGTRYQSTITQVTNASATQAEVDFIGADFDVITDILTNGTAGVTDILVANSIYPSTDIEVNRAYTLLLENKAYIESEAVAYVEATKTNGYSYDKAKCGRDTGYMVDSVAFDLLHGGNRQAIQSGVSYYGFSGTSSAIPNESTQTVAAFNFIKSISRQIVQNNPVTPYQTVVPQVLDLPGSSDIQGAVFGTKIDVITRIISGGTSEANTLTPISLTRTTSTSALTAAAVLDANREFIQAEVIAYLDNTLNYFYDPALCYRDVGYMIDSVSFDLLHGGNRQAVHSGVYYYGFDASASAVEGQRIETQFAYNHIAELTNKILSGDTVTLKYQSTVTQVISPAASVNEVVEAQEKIGTIVDIIAKGPGVAGAKTPISLVASTDPNRVNAFNAIIANREFIQAETISYVNASFNGFSYDKVKCARDTGIIIDSLGLDLLYNGSSQSAFAGLQYWNQGEYTGSIAGELTTTTAAINYVKELATKIVRNVTTGTRYQSTVTQVTNLQASNTASSLIVEGEFDLITQILNSGTDGITDLIVANGGVSSDINVTRAYALLQANKSYMQHEAIAFVEATKTGGFEFDRTKCARDVGYIVDGAYYDIGLGTNYNAVTSGKAYQRGIASSQAVIDKELVQTTTAIEYAQSRVAALVADSATSVTRSNAAFDETLDIILNNTPNTITFTNPVGGDVNKAHAKDQLIANKAFIASELTTWINTQKTGNITPFTSAFTYDVSKCERDVGDIIDALCYDILYGGNSASVIAARAYFVGAVSVLPEDQRAPSAAAMAQLSSIAQQVVRETYAGQDVSGTPASVAEANRVASLMSIIETVITDNSLDSMPLTVYPAITWADVDVQDALANVVAYRNTIVKDTVDNVRIRYSSFFNYNQDNCLRDTGLLVDAIAWDLLQGGTSQSNFAGLQYWNQAGYTGAIANELTTTTNAINYMAGLVSDIVNTAGGVAPQSAFISNINKTIDILSNGTVGVTDAIVPNGSASTATNFVNAYNAIRSTKNSVITQTINWINSNNVGFTYDQTKCERDLGFIIDSSAFDLLHGGNKQSIMSGVYYYGYNSTSTVLVNEVEQSTAAFNKIKAMITNIVTGQLIENPYQPYIKQVISSDVATTAEANTLIDNLTLITDIINQGTSVADAPTPISLTSSTDPNVQNAFDLLMANREFIKQEVIAYVNSEFVGPAYNRTKCRRDTAIIVDSLAQDLMFEGSSQSNFSALSYWNQSSYTGQIQSELSTTTNAISFIGELAQQIVIGETKGLRYASGITQKSDLPTATQAEADIIKEKFNLLVNIILNGTAGVTDMIVPNSLVESTDANILNAYALLEANKVFLQTQAIAFVEATKTAGFSYNSDTCYRDIGYITDSIAFDLLYGGNRQTIQSAVYYYGFNADDSALKNEMEQATAAYEFIKTLAANVIKGDFIEDTYQDIVKQVLSNSVGTDAEVSQVNSNVDLITSIINNGPSAANAKTPISIKKTTNSSVINAANLLVDNKDFIVAEVVAYINYTFGGYQYNKAKCFRDVGYMIDSVSFDLLHGGNRQAIQSGVYYYSFNGSDTAIPNEIPQTVAAYTYLKSLISNVVTATPMPRVYQTGTTQTIALSPGTGAEVTSLTNNVNLILEIISSGPSVAPAKTPIGLTASNSVGVTRAYNLLMANKQFIINELTAYIDASFVRFNYNKEKCYRDVDSILNAVIYDVLYTGNYCSVNTGNGYFSRKGRYHIINLEENTQDPTLFVDGSTVNFYQRSYQSASGYLFEYIGAGTNYSALPQIGRKDPIQSHETVQLNNGKVFFTSTDQNGDFRIGPGLVISQATGVLYGRTFQKSLYAEMTPFILVVGA